MRIVTKMFINVSHCFQIVTTIAEVDMGVSLYPADLQAINIILQDALRVFNESFILTNISNIDVDVSIYLQCPNTCIEFCKCHKDISPYQQSVVEVFNGMLSIDNLAGWTELQHDNPTLAGELLLKNAENYALFLAKSLDTSSMTNRTIQKENIGIYLQP